MSLTAVQLSNRSSGLGGSDAAAAVNLSRWKSPLRLWQEKVGEVAPDDLSDNEAVHFGNVLEDVVADEFSRRRGLKLQRDRRTLRHPDHEFMLAHIDRRVVGAREGLECKTASLRMVKEWGEEDTDAVPIEYLAQSAHYMAVTGFDAWHVAVLIAGNDFRMYRIERDPELIESLIAREREFWSHVQTRTPPEPTTIEDAFARWPQDTGKSIVANDLVLNDLGQYRNLKTAEKDLAMQLEATRLRICNFMQDATTLLSWENKPLCTWKTQSANRIDPDSLRANFPDIATQCSKVSQSRVFRLK
jgi:putative phage-type endonuclease